MSRKSEVRQCEQRISRSEKARSEFLVTPSSWLSQCMQRAYAAEQPLNETLTALLTQASDRFRWPVPLSIAPQRKTISYRCAAFLPNAADLSISDVFSAVNLLWKNDLPLRESAAAVLACPFDPGTLTFDLLNIFALNSLNARIQDDQHSRKLRPYTLTFHYCMQEG